MAPATHAPPRPPGDLAAPIELPATGTGRRTAGHRTAGRRTAGRRTAGRPESGGTDPARPLPAVQPVPADELHAPAPAIGPPSAPAAPAAPVAVPEPLAAPEPAFAPERGAPRPLAGDPVGPDDPTDFFATGDEPEPTWEPSRFSPALMVAVLFILIGVLLGLLALWVDQGSGGGQSAPAATAAPPTTAVPTSVPTTAVPTTAAPTTAAPTTAVPTTLPAPPLAGLPVEVLNGAGIQGAAADVAGRITSADATITQTANADRFDHPVTLIVHGDAAHASAAEEVRALLGVGQVQVDPGLVGAGAAITVVVGEDWTG